MWGAEADVPHLGSDSRPAPRGSARICRIRRYTFAVWFHHAMVLSLTCVHTHTGRGKDVRDVFKEMCTRLPCRNTSLCSSPASSQSMLTSPPSSDAATRCISPATLTGADAIQVRSAFSRFLPPKHSASCTLPGTDGACGALRRAYQRSQNERSVGDLDLLWCVPPFRLKKAHTPPVLNLTVPLPLGSGARG